MTSEQLEALSDASAKKAIHEFVKNDLGQCTLCTDREYWDKHRKDHEFIDEVIETLKKMQVVKWGSFKNLASLVLVTATGWVVLHLFGIKFP